jgi:hypothetical protein
VGEDDADRRRTSEPDAALEDRVGDVDEPSGLGEEPADEDDEPVESAALRSQNLDAGVGNPTSVQNS